jgi:hypothetical protein
MTSCYKTYITDEIMSVVITTEYINVEYNVYTCDKYVYNFNLKTKEEATFEDVYKKVGFDEENIDTSVENGIEKYVKDYVKEEDLEYITLDDCVDMSVDEYETYKGENRLGYFINNKKELVVIVGVSDKEEIKLREIPVTKKVNNKDNYGTKAKKYVTNASYTPGALKDRFYIDPRDVSIKSLDQIVLPHIELDGEDARLFNRLAKKYGVDYAIVKDKQTGNYKVFFKAQDADAISDLVADYTRRTLGKEKGAKESILSKLKKLKEKIASLSRKVFEKRKEQTR